MLPSMGSLSNSPPACCQLILSKHQLPCVVRCQLVQDAGWRYRVCKGHCYWLLLSNLYGIAIQAPKTITPEIH